VQAKPEARLDARRLDPISPEAGRREQPDSRQETRIGFTAVAVGSSLAADVREQGAHRVLPDLTGGASPRAI
jgi:hypothetical protein